MMIKKIIRKILYKKLGLKIQPFTIDETTVGKMRLDLRKYLDRSIYETGYFEKLTNLSVKKLLNEGDIVLDVGANIGYYSLLFSKLVGDSGKVICFEPTKCYLNELRYNLKLNRISNCIVEDFGLSSKLREIDISIGDSSATLHWTEEYMMPKATEKIKLKTLDSYILSNSRLGEFPHIDFIKVDIDGHEPDFLKGALKTIEKYKPIILLEISQDHYLQAGHNAIDFYDYLKELRFMIYDEELSEFTSKRDYLVRCANFTSSANVFISQKPLSI